MCNDDKISWYAANLPPLVIQEISGLAQKNGAISFAAGLPDASLFPLSLFTQTLRSLENCTTRLQYSEPQLELEILRIFLQQRNIYVETNQLLLTNGAQQAINILSKYFVASGKLVMAEDLTYPGFIQNIVPLKADIHTIRVDQYDGIDLGHMENILKKNQKNGLIYVIPDGHNPLGISWDLQRRNDFLMLAQKYGVTVIEDDPYGLLAYSESCNALRALNEEVIYVGTLSKILMPALRVGWIVAPAHIVKRLRIIKDSIDLNVSSFSQSVGLHMTLTEEFSSHLSIIRESYKQKRDAMLDTLYEYFPEQSRYSAPKHGIFIWVTVPGVDFYALFNYLVRYEKVLCLPGNLFTLHKYAYKDCIRINFSYVSIAQIQVGIKRLGNAIKKHLVRI